MAAGLCLGVTLWSLRAVLPAPTVTSPYRAILAGQNWLRIEQSDQRFVAWNVARDARLMLTHPTRLFDGDQQCHPPRTPQQQRRAGCHAPDSRFCAVTTPPGSDCGGTLASPSRWLFLPSGRSASKRAR